MIADCGVISGWQRVSANPLGRDQECATGGTTGEFLGWYRLTFRVLNTVEDSLRNQKAANLGVLMGRIIDMRGLVASMMGVGANCLAVLTVVTSTRGELLRIGGIEWLSLWSSPGRLFT